MNRINGAVVALSVATALNFAQSASAFADVIVNNFSLITTIQIGPDHRVSVSPAWWLHDPRHNQRCYQRWNPNIGEWQMYCVRMRHWGGGPYRD